MFLQFAARLVDCNSWQEKVQAFVEVCSFSKLNLSPDHCKILCDVIYKRLVWVFNYDTSKLQPINSPITLLKPTIRSFKTNAEDYDLSKVCLQLFFTLLLKYKNLSFLKMYIIILILYQITTGPIEIHYLSGDHFTIMDDEKAAFVINGDLSSDKKPAFVIDEIDDSRKV